MCRPSCPAVHRTQADDGLLGLGVSLHLADIWVSEVRASGARGRTVVQLLRPFVALLAGDGAFAKPRSRKTTTATRASPALRRRPPLPAERLASLIKRPQLAQSDTSLRERRNREPLRG